MKFLVAARGQSKRSWGFGLGPVARQLLYHDKITQSLPAENGANPAMSE